MIKRAKIHVDRRYEVLRDLEYVWESERLALVELLNKFKIVDDFVLDYIKNFEEYACFFIFIAMFTLLLSPLIFCFVFHMIF